MILVIVPRWAGTPDSDFYPWLAELGASKSLVGISSVQRLAMPDPETPRIEGWTQHILQHLSATSERTIVLAHSVGCQAALRALATAASPAVYATLLVAPWRTVDKPWATLRPWIDEPFNLTEARQRAGRVHALISDNDPFTSDWASTKTWLENDLNADVTVCAGARHFNSAEEPAVRSAIEALDGAPASGA